MVELDDFEKAISQILIAYGTIENAKLEALLEQIRKDFPGSTVRVLKESFARINTKLIKLSLEIKSVVRSKCRDCETITNIRAPTCESCSSPASKSEWVYYHGFVNTEGDAVSKDEGSELLPDEIKFFSELTQKLLENSYMSTDDVYGLKNSNWTPSQTDIVLEKLRSKGWLQRDERSFWEIGKTCELLVRIP